MTTTEGGTLFGELYLRSTKPFLTEPLTQAEADFITARLPPGAKVLDLGCGHGRHLSHLANGVGVDFDAASLREAMGKGRPVVKGRFQALPFADGAFGGVSCWYNTLGTGSLTEARAAVGEVARVLKPGGLLIAQSDNPVRAAEQPVASFRGRLPDGSQLDETSRYQSGEGRDVVWRRLTLPDGRVMEASFFLRYYDVSAWRRLLSGTGLELAWTCGGLDGSPVGEGSRDVIVGAKKRG